MPKRRHITKAELAEFTDLRINFKHLEGEALKRYYALASKKGYEARMAVWAEHKRKQAEEKARAEEAERHRGVLAEFYETQRAILAEWGISS